MACYGLKSPPTRDGCGLSVGAWSDAANPDRNIGVSERPTTSCGLDARGVRSTNEYKLAAANTAVVLNSVKKAHSVGVESAFCLAFETIYSHLLKVSP